ncbi:MAG: SGNH/GDSL hydrolase family protein [Candidatus Hydrogenedentes bacterium]|nr:SGNH/GDSL hydrolase family protein [Candidatus Hydrogenedentota bacterium]
MQPGYLLASVLLLAGSAAAQETAALADTPKIEALDPNMAAQEPGTNRVWYNGLDLGVEGQGWKDVASPFDRLPGRAEGVVRDPVWSLSRRSAGLCLRFVTNADAIAARWTLRNEELAMDHMAATGVSGLDLYVRENSQWRWVAVGKPTKFPTNEVSLIQKIKPGPHEYLLYLPLYNGVESLEIGVAQNVTIAKAPPRPVGSKPICFYGTSITQGGCAARPGMAYAAILGRWLDVETINLGFSGNGEMEPEMAELISELDAAVFVLDCLPNMDADQINERYVKFVQRLRERRPETPLVIVGHIIPQNLWFSGERSQKLGDKAAAIETAFKTLREQNVPGLHFVAGESLLGQDGEDTVDGVHPTDLGFKRIAEALYPVLKALLNSKNSG